MKKFIPTVSHWIWCVINILFIRLFITVTPFWTVWKVSLSSAVKWKCKIYVLKFGLRAIGCIVTHYSLLHQTHFVFLFFSVYISLLLVSFSRTKENLLCWQSAGTEDVLFFPLGVFNVNSESINKNWKRTSVIGTTFCGFYHILLLLGVQF